MIDHDRAAGGQADFARKRGLDLVLDLEAIEQRQLVFEMLELVDRAGHDHGHEIVRLAIGFFGIDQYLADIAAVVVAQRAHDDIGFLVDQERCLLVGRGLFDRLPDLGQVVEVPLHFLDRTTDTGGAHDDTHTFRHGQLCQHLLELVAILALDTTRYAAGTRVLRHRHQEAAGQADEAGQCRTLVAALFLFDLDDYLLVDLEHILEYRLAVAVARCVAEILLGDFLEREKAVAFGAVVDESGFEAGFYAGDLTLVYVGLFLLASRDFDIEVVEFLAIDHGHPEFFGLGGVD